MSQGMEIVWFTLGMITCYIMLKCWIINEQDTIINSYKKTIMKIQQDYVDMADEIHKFTRKRLNEELMK